jgi:hypothetical protein
MEKKTNTKLYGDSMKNVVKKEVTKLYRGYLVSIRDYERDRAVEKGGMILKHNNQTMFFSPDVLKRLKAEPKLHSSKFPPYKKYRLIDIRWNPTEGEDQVKLFK